jgi:hypothetical protein
MVVESPPLFPAQLKYHIQASISCKIIVTLFLYSSCLQNPDISTVPHPSGLAKLQCSLPYFFDLNSFFGGIGSIIFSCLLQYMLGLRERLSKL